MTLNRVVVTGYGLTSPIGNTPEEFWNNLHDGKIGIGPITKFDNSEIKVHNAGEIHDFPFDKYFVRKDKNRMDQYSLYAIYATLEALENAKLDMDTVDRDRTGVIVSSGIGGLQEMQEQIIRMHEKGIKRIQPMFIPKALSNMAAGNIALRIGARGVCKSITTACASSNDAIGEAFREIKFGYHDVILAGGAESTINEIGIGGFNALTALSTTEDPARSAIPFDKDRNGFVMGEGAGVLVLESLEHAQKRGATILAEVVGYGSNCDAYHQTTPTPDGSGAAKAIELAIKEAGISPEDVDYVNAHGTSTQANEKGEVVYPDDDGNEHVLDPTTPVSMNFWGFTPDYFEFSEREFVKFLDQKINEPKSEFFIPTVVDLLIKSGEAKVKLLDTHAKWFGVTYAEDRPGVVAKLADLHAQGIYPGKMF